jgi:hypothetical protein
MEYETDEIGKAFEKMNIRYCIWQGGIAGRDLKPLRTVNLRCVSFVHVIDLSLNY